MLFALIVAILLPMLLGAAFLLGRHLPRRRERADAFSPVSRQHFELFQGGPVNEAVVEAAKRRFRALLERGEDAAVEASIRPGMQFVFQVRALAEIGSDAAGKILERQLQRHLTDDDLEQAWYRIDLAGSLRVLNRAESLPHLLRCADAAGDVPLGHFFAAETVCFVGFAGYLRRPETPLGRASLLLLHRAFEGLRYGLPAQVVAEARLGEMLEDLWDNRPDGFQPLLVRIVHEAVRFLRRAEHARAALEQDGQEVEAFAWQMERLSALEPIWLEYLSEAPLMLRRQVSAARHQALADVLGALCDLRVDAGVEVLALLERGAGACLEPAIQALTWCKNPRVGVWLREFAARRVPMQRRSQWRPRTRSPEPPSLPPEAHYPAVLRALRGQASRETERFLMLAAQDWDPRYRAVAVASLGWWEPFLRGPVRQCLEGGRRDPNSQVRQAARAALARLGERAALYWFRQGLLAEDSAKVLETMQIIAEEGLTLLWPELDRLADCKTPEIAQFASEALERMAEDLPSK